MRTARRRAWAILGATAGVVATAAAAPSVYVSVDSGAMPIVNASPTPAGLQLDSLAEYLAQDGRRGAILVSVGSEVVAHRGFGVSAPQNPVAVSATTAFNAGAVAKMLTAAAIMLLDNEGRLSVEDPLSRWIGALPSPKDRATIHDVLVHSGGLTHVAHPVFSSDRDAFLDAVRTAPHDFAPGERSRYTDIGYSVLAAIVELASGMPYEAFVRQRLLEPAGMRETFFESENGSAAAAPEFGALVPGAQRSRVGRRDYVWGRRGGMGVVSTVADLHRWHAALDAGLLGPRNRVRTFTAVPDRWRGVSVGYGWETARTERGTVVHRFLSGWPGNSVELVYEPSTRTRVAIIVDARVNWDHPRAYDVLAVVAGGAPAAAAASMAANTPRG